MKFFSLAVAVLAVLTVSAIAADEPAKVEVGKPAPEINLPATSIETVLKGKDAKTLSLKDLKGKNVVMFLTITP